MVLINIVVVSLWKIVMQVVNILIANYISITSLPITNWLVILVLQFYISLAIFAFCLQKL